MQAQRRSPQAMALFGVIALHLALLWSLRAAMAPASDRNARAPAAPVARVTVRLLPPREVVSPPRIEAAVSTTPTAAAPAHAAAVHARPALTGPLTPTPEAPTQIDAAAAPLPALPASQPPRALDLALPRGFALRPEARNPAIDDPRANTARTTPEDRLAAALDTRVIEESLGDGRKRIRRGADCVIVTPSRIGQLMPFNDAATRTPASVGACR